jgi:hypothetical protein
VIDIVAKPDRAQQPMRVFLAVSLAAAGLFATMSVGEAAARADETCLAVMPPTVEGVQDSATEVAYAARDLLVSILNGPSTPVVPLDARLEALASDEARQKGCDRVLVARLTRKRSSGGGFFRRLVGQAGGVAAGQLPGGGIGGTVVRGVAVAGAHEVLELASSTRAKDEMRLTYRLASGDGRTVLKPRSVKIKATVDGEDLLTPLMQRAAESIASSVAAKRTGAGRP